MFWGNLDITCIIPYLDKTILPKQEALEGEM